MTQILMEEARALLRGMEEEIDPDPEVKAEILRVEVGEVKLKTRLIRNGIIEEETIIHRLRLILKEEGEEEEEVEVQEEITSVSSVERLVIWLEIATMEEEEVGVEWEEEEEDVITVASLGTWQGSVLIPNVRDQIETTMTTPDTSDKDETTWVTE
jgi:hypothetical protein